MWNLLLVMGLLWSLSLLGTLVLAAVEAARQQVRLRLARTAQPRSPH